MGLRVLLLVIAVLTVALGGVFIARALGEAPGFASWYVAIVCLLGGGALGIYVVAPQRSR